VLGKRILILGGTAEARVLASLLLRLGHEPISSLAGVTAQPNQPEGRVRIGGFGGTAGLAQYCKENEIVAVADAAHPFAAQISRHAAEAAHALGLPIVRLDRPGWLEQPGDRWFRVSDVASAVRAVPDNARVLLTIGRKEAAAFFERSGISGIARMIEPPTDPVPPNWTLLLVRPPFTLNDERALMRVESISCLVCKDAGGDNTRAKLDAARERGIPVIMITRPRKPNVLTADSPDAVGALLENLVRT
jgi:precorrin-6A/cobalt-precorrin-6A reductase